MKLSADSIKLLDNLIQTANIAGIQKLIIEKDSIRGADENVSVVILSKDNVPDFGTLNVGMNRLGILQSRLNLVKSTGEFEVEAVASKIGKGTDVSHLILSSKNTSVQYRCAAVEAIKSVPKTLNDTPEWLISIPGKSITLVNMAISAMAADRLTVTAKKTGGIYFEAIDSNNDIFSNQFAESATFIPEDEDAPEDTIFSYSYDVKTILPLFKAASNNGADDVDIIFSKRGIITIIVNGCDFYVAQKV